MSPVDVVLDERAALVVQPDIIFVARAHLDRVGDRVWGAPDLVVEVLSPRTARRDRTTKRRWYQRYGVVEYWLVEMQARRVDVLHLAARRARARQYAGGEPMRSVVLPGWQVTPAEIFS